MKSSCPIGITNARLHEVSNLVLSNISFTRGAGGWRFTLLELLAILACLLLPSLIRTRQVAVSVACVNNLWQLDVAWMLYPMDYQDSLVPNYISGFHNPPAYLRRLQNQYLEIR
jgi:hypothetical protein